MRLKTVVFYQGVKLWDGNLFQTVQEGPNKGNKNVTISIENHVVTLECEGKSEVIIVGTSNMREARYWREPSSNSGKISRESHTRNPTGTGALGEAVENAARSILGSPEQEEQSASVSIETGSSESDGRAISGAVPGFSPEKYMTPTTDKKVTKPTRAKKETK